MKTLLLFLILSINSFAADSLGDHLFDIEKNDIKQIKKNKYIRILTTKNEFDYYIYQGRHKGYQYEMVKSFVDYINKKYVKKSKIKIQFEMIPVDYDQLIPMLKEGKGDLIASNLTITKERKSKVSFSKTIKITDEVLIKNKNVKKIKKVYVRKSSSYYKTLKKFNYKIIPVDEKLSTTQIIELVSNGELEATVSDRYYADIAKKVFKNIIIEKPLVKNRKIAWATRKDSPGLLWILNNFIPKIKKGSYLGNIFKNRYFQDVNHILKYKKQKRISPFDELIKKYAKKYNWDWRLLVSLCYQESRFKANIENEWGAIGLFQIKQMTANEPYVNIKNVSGYKNIENNIHAGVKYLSWIKKRYFDPIKNMEERDRLRLTIASYNAGPGRVRRAIKKAKKMKLNPNKWFRNVEFALAKLNYMEPVNYVSEINKRYLSYKLLGF